MVSLFLNHKMNYPQGKTLENLGENSAQKRFSCFPKHRNWPKLFSNVQAFLEFALRNIKDQ